MDVPRNEIPNVLRDSITEGLEDGQKGSKFSTFHGYFDMDGDDVDNETVRKLRDDFEKIMELLPELPLGVYSEGKFVTVNNITDTVRLTNPDAGFYLTSVGAPRSYSARGKLLEMVEYSIGVCDEAIRRDGGFGKYTSN